MYSPHVTTQKLVFIIFSNALKFHSVLLLVEILKWWQLYKARMEFQAWKGIRSVIWCVHGSLAAWYIWGCMETSVPA